MKVDLDAGMFASSPQPFVLLDEKAKPVYANSSAQSLLPILGKHRLLWLRQFLHCTQTQQDTPYRLPPENLPADVAGWEVWLSLTDAGEFALWFMPDAPELALDAAGAAGLSLFGRRMRDELTAFASMLRNSFPDLVNSDAVPLHLDFVAKSRRLSEILDDVALLSELQERHPFQQDERIYLYSLINQAIGNLELAAESIDWQVDTAGLMLAPIFGNRHWLSLGVSTYLRRLVEGLEGEPGTVFIQFQQIGGCAIVSGHTGPLTEAVAASGRRLQATPSEMPNSNLKLLLAERVLSLHGADVKTGRRESMRHIDSFSLSFPTSFPYAAKPDVWCQECPALEQSLVFARDFATLTKDRSYG